MKKIIISLIFLILLSLTAFSFYLKPYSQEGFSDETYSSMNNYGQNCLFNSGFNAVYGTPNTYVRSVSNSKYQAPISTDITGSGDYPAFDGQGIFRLFVGSANSILIYQDKFLTLNQSLVLDSTVFKYKSYSFNNISYLVALDTGGFVVNPKLYVFKDFGNHTFIQTQKRGLQYLTFSNPAGGDWGSIECNSGVCVVAETTSTYSKVYGAAFNISDDNNNTNFSMIVLGQKFGGDSEILPPHTFNIVSKDIDNDGNIEFMFPLQIGYSAYMMMSRYIVSTRTLQPVFNYTTSIISIGVVGTLQNMILGNFNSQSTSTYALAFKKTPSQELVIASGYWDGTLWKDFKHHYPLFNRDVSTISNVFACKVFTNDNEFNYCAVGYTDIIANATILIGATDFGVGLAQSDTIIAYSVNNTNYYLPSLNNRENIAHAIQASNNIQSGYTISDILTPFGIYKLNNPNYLTGYSTLTKEFSIPTNIPNAIISPVRMKNTPFYDLVALTTSNIIYIDDKQLITPAQIDSYTINPCINQVWKINTTVSVSLQPRSQSDLFNVKGEATLYYGTNNAQIGNTSTFLLSNSIFTYTFVANETINNGILRLYAQDDQNSGMTHIDIPYTVSTVGASFGECQTQVTGIIATNLANQTAINNNLTNPYTNTNNVLKAGFDAQAIAMGVPSLILFLLVLTGVDIVVFLTSMTSPQLRQHTMGVFLGIIFFDLLMIIIATLMGILSAAFIITIILIMVCIVALYLSYMFNKSQGS